MEHLKPEQIKENWDDLMEYINKYISEPRRQKLLDFYEKFDVRIGTMPASQKKEYHNAFAGGYVDHVLRVIKCSIKVTTLWESMGATINFTKEELIFSALNHDLGKIGDEEHESYVPQTDKWRRDKLGEVYTFNNKLPFASVPDRGLFLLQSHGIQYTFNEMLAIQTHDGVYDEANKKYLMTWSAEQKPRTCLPYILHQADVMAARIEFEKEWYPTLFAKEDKKSVPAPSKSHTLQTNNKPNTQQQALKSVQSAGLKSLLDNL